MAVDYIKSGKPATMHKSLNAKAFPHFMERKIKSKNYKSHKPVGRIYDRVNVEKFTPAYDLPFDDRILKRFELTAEELSKAKEIKAKYDIAMRRLMGQHECPVSEFEIWSTFVLSKPRVGTDYKLAEQIGRDVSSLKDRFRIICGEAVRDVEQKTTVFSYSGIDLANLDRFVAAMYKVTHEEVQTALHAREMPVLDEEGNKVADDQVEDFPMPLISFPWLFTKELARVAKGSVPVTWAKKASDTEEKNAIEELSPKSSAKVATLLDTESSEEQEITGKEEGAFYDANGSEIGTADEDYVRTTSGQVVHRGEILQLFDDKGEIIDGSHASCPSSLPRSKTPSSSKEPAVTPDSPQSKEYEDDRDRDRDGDGDEIEVEIANSDDDEDEEDVLEAMAKKLARS